MDGETCVQPWKGGGGQAGGGGQGGGGVGAHVGRQLRKPGRGAWPSRTHGQGLKQILMAAGSTPVESGDNPVSANRRWIKSVVRPYSGYYSACHAMDKP